MLRWADAIAFSSLLAAAVAGALSIAASLALAAPNLHRWAFLASAGTFIIYNLDRLRDLEHDRTSSPIRTAFVSRHQRILYEAVLIAAIGFTAVLFTSAPAIILLCLAVGVVGLFHRRIKRTPTFKALYVSTAWVAVCLGFPWIASGHNDLGIWLAGIFFLSLTANLIASNLRDGKVIRAPSGHNMVLWLARGFILLALALVFAGPGRLLPLVWIPVYEGLALALFRPTERYGHLVIDGALLLGALITSAHYQWSA